MTGPLRLLRARRAVKARSDRVANAAERETDVQHARVRGMRTRAYSTMAGSGLKGQKRQSEGGEGEGRKRQSEQTFATRPKHPKKGAKRRVEAERDPEGEKENTRKKRKKES